MLQDIASGRASVLRTALAMLMCLVGAFSTNAAGGHAGKLTYGRMHDHPNTLVMVWKGEIRRGMAAQIVNAFTRNKHDTDRIVFRLDSPGGSVLEGERVIQVLQQIKQTHKLATSVGAGKKCGSMCVFIYVQGQVRLAAPASLWLFHEVSRMNKARTKIVALNRERWIALVDKYWVPAGVDAAWIEGIKNRADKMDVWESGSDLLKDGSNLVQRKLSNDRRRIVAPPEVTH